MYQRQSSDNPYQEMLSNPNYLGGQYPQEDMGYYAHGGHIEHEGNDFSDYHQDVDADDNYDEGGAPYPHYYNNLLRAHLAQGGSVSSFMQHLRNTATNAAPYARAALRNIGQGARYVGNTAYGLGRGLGSAAYGLGRGAYNLGRQAISGARRPAAPASPSGTWAGYLGSAGRTAGDLLGGLGGNLAGRFGGAVAGPHVGALAMQVGMPYVPGFISRTVGGGLGGMLGMPIGGAIGGRVGSTAGRYLGEGLGSRVGGGLDYLGQRGGEMAERATAAVNPYLDRTEAYIRPVASGALRGLSTVGQYTPAAFLANRLASLPPLGPEASRFSESPYMGERGSAFSPVREASPLLRRPGTTSPSGFYTPTNELPWNRALSPD